MRKFKLWERFIIEIKKLKHPGILCFNFWQYMYRTIQESFAFIVLLILFNFIPYIYLFSLYEQYSNGIGGLFKPFADIILLAMIIRLFPKVLQYKLQVVILLVNGILSLMEIFVVGKYYTFMTAGIVSVIIGTNIHETVEFIKMYISWQYVAIVVVFIIVAYLLKFLAKKVKTIQLSKWIIIFTPYFFLYSFFYTIIPNHNVTECLTFTRLSAPICQAINDAIAFHDIYNNMNSNVKLTENKSDIPNVVFILGESTSRRHMSLYGYDLPTTPKLDEMKAKGELYVFNDVISPHAYTIGSLREMFTFHNYESSNKWYETNNLFDVLNEAGYTTYWLSNQETSGEWANVALAYANRCSYKEFTGVRQSYETSYRADGELLPLVYRIMDNDNPKNFYLLHLMGTHGDYKNRYTPDFAKFKAKDEHKSLAEQRELTAEYDNAILYNDTIVTQIMTAFKDKNAIVIYMPDHGEEVYDTKNSRGHSDDDATPPMLEIPFIIYTTPSFQEKYPELNKRIANAVDKPFMTDDLIHLMLDIMQIKTDEYQESRSLISPLYNQERKRMFLGKDYDLEIKDKSK